MRTRFVNKLISLAEKDSRINVILGDIGYSVFEGYQSRFPDRILNAGVAEQNMSGVAAGFALSGKVVFLYSIVPFVTMRCFEQIRNDICSQNLNVKIVGVGGGLCYGSAGITHHSIEDISIMRSLPNMTIFCPGDPTEAEQLTEIAAGLPGPVYIRLGRSSEPRVHMSPIKLVLGRGVMMSKGSEAVLISSGNMLSIANEVCEALVKEGYQIGLMSMPSIKPIDRELITSTTRETKAIFTIEEHSVIGGLGSAVSEILAESSAGVRFLRFGVPDTFVKDVGTQEYLRACTGLSKERLILSIKDKLKQWNIHT